jgi:hypothetical protein
VPILVAIFSVCPNMEEENKEFADINLQAN